MTDSAQLLSRLRSSFATTNTTFSGNANSNNADSSQSPIIATPVASPTSSLTTNSSTLTQTDALDVLDQVLQEVEQDLVTRVAVKSGPPQPAATALAGSAASLPNVEPTAYTEPIEPTTAVDPGVLAQAVPTATLQTADLLNPQHLTTTSKESVGGTASNEIAPESGGGLQYVEQEKPPEIPVEVESYLHRIEQSTDQAPQEIVVADGTDIAALPTNTPTQPVIVLPITPAVEQVGEKKSPKWSVRWLVEWSRKIMKMFMGKVIYREEAPVSAS